MSFKNDYTKEVGIARKESNVPLPIVIVVFAIIGACLWLGLRAHKSAPNPDVAANTAAKTHK